MCNPVCINSLVSGNCFPPKRNIDEEIEKDKVEQKLNKLPDKSGREPKRVPKVWCR